MEAQCNAMQCCNAISWTRSWTIIPLIPVLDPTGPESGLRISGIGIREFSLLRSFPGIGTIIINDRFICTGTVVSSQLQQRRSQTEQTIIRDSSPLVLIERYTIYMKRIIYWNIIQYRYHTEENKGHHRTSCPLIVYLSLLILGSYLSHLEAGKIC